MGCRLAGCAPATQLCPKKLDFSQDKAAGSPLQRLLPDVLRECYAKVAMSFENRLFVAEPSYAHDLWKMRPDAVVSFCVCSKQSDCG